MARPGDPARLPGDGTWAQAPSAPHGTPGRGRPPHHRCPGEEGGLRGLPPTPDRSTLNLVPLLPLKPPPPELPCAAPRGRRSGLAPSAGRGLPRLPPPGSGLREAPACVKPPPARAQAARRARPRPSSPLPRAAPGPRQAPPCPEPPPAPHSPTSTRMAEPGAHAPSGADCACAFSSRTTPLSPGVGA